MQGGVVSPESAKCEAERCTGDDGKRTHAVCYNAADRSCEAEEDLGRASLWIWWTGRHGEDEKGRASYRSERSMDADASGRVRAYKLVVSRSRNLLSAAKATYCSQPVEVAPITIPCNMLSTSHKSNVPAFGGTTVASQYARPTVNNPQSASQNSLVKRDI